MGRPKQLERVDIHTRMLPGDLSMFKGQAKSRGMDLGVTIGVIGKEWIHLRTENVRKDEIIEEFIEVEITYVPSHLLNEKTKKERKT